MFPLIKSEFEGDRDDVQTSVDLINVMWLSTGHYRGIFKDFYQKLDHELKFPRNIRQDVFFEGRCKN